MLESLDLKNIYFENICERLLGAYMSLKSYKLDQGATEMFISESLCNAMSENTKTAMRRKANFERSYELSEMSGS